MEGALFSGLEHDRYAKPHAICFCMKYFSPTHVHTAANYDWLAAFLNGAADKMQYVYISCIAGEVSGTHHCRRSFHPLVGKEREIHARFISSYLSAILECY